MTDGNKQFAEHLVVDFITTVVQSDDSLNQIWGPVV